EFGALRASRPQTSVVMAATSSGTLVKSPRRSRSVVMSRSAPRRMKGDRVTIRILCDEEATEGAIGKRGEDGAASPDERVVQHAGVVAGDPEHHAHAEWPGFGKRPHRLSQRQRDRRCLEHDRARRIVSCRFETEYLYVKLSGRGEISNLQGDEIRPNWCCHGDP